MCEVLIAAGRKIHRMTFWGETSLLKKGKQEWCHRLRTMKSLAEFYYVSNKISLFYLTK